MNSKRHKSSRAGALRLCPTLGEAILIIFIIGILAAISVPNFQASRSRSNERAARADWKTLQGAMEMYNLDNNAKIQKVDRRMLEALKQQGYIQAVPNLDRMQRYAPQGAPVALQEGAHTGKLLPHEQNWMGLARPSPVPEGPPIPPPHTEEPLPTTWVRVAEDPLSTFAVDVDTGSYTLARAELQAGRLPAAATVRVEEFVNYFDYADRAPTDQTFAVHLEGGASPWSGERHLLRVGIKAREVSAEARPPLALTFVVDVSGSMGGPTRLGLVRDSLSFLVEQLREGDRVGIVTYGTNARVHLPRTDASRREGILRMIRNLRTEGATNAEAGLVEGYRQALGDLREGASNRVILCSDGVANVGHTTAQAILARIAEHADRGVYLSTFGFGMGNYSDSFMEQLADKGDGAYAYLDDFEEARRVFGEELTSTLMTVAKDAKIQVEFDPRSVRSYRLLGYENRDVADQDFRNDAVDAGEIGPGHAVTALYELVLSGEEESLGAVRLRFQQPDGPAITEIQQPILREALRSSPRLRLASLVARFAEGLRSGPHSEGLDLSRMAAEARDLVKELPGDEKVSELSALVEIAARLSRAS